MAREIINEGTVANDGTGDALRVGAVKINANFSEIYNALGNGSTVTSVTNANGELDLPYSAGIYHKVSFNVPDLSTLNTIDPATYQGAIISVTNKGQLYVAHQNAWYGVLMDASTSAIPNYTDPLSTVAYTGNYSDLQNTPSFANVPVVIDDLQDVDTTSITPATGTVLKWNGAQWVPGADITAGGTGVDSDTLDGQDGSYYLNYNNFFNKPTLTLAGILANGNSADRGIFPNANNQYKLGDVNLAWSEVHATIFEGTATSAEYADLAEIYEPDQEYEPGTVVCIGGEKEITISNSVASTKVLGVISTLPAYLMNNKAKGLPVALQGRVPCKVQGPVKKGDMLVSGPNGVAVSTSEFVGGAMIGKSLENHNADSIATIEIVVGVR